MEISVRYEHLLAKDGYFCVQFFFHCQTPPRRCFATESRLPLSRPEFPQHVFAGSFPSPPHVRWRLQSGSWGSQTGPHCEYKDMKHIERERGASFMFLWKERFNLTHHKMLGMPIVFCFFRPLGGAVRLSTNGNQYRNGAENVHQLGWWPAPAYL